jgi:hypothetical protein
MRRRRAGAMLSATLNVRRAVMPKVSREGASVTHEAPGYEGRFEDLGGYTVAFETYSEDSDLTPLFAGLPDDRCQCPHWGIVLKGAITFRYASGDETIEAGEAYFAPPGHTPILHAGTEVVEFSPTHELMETFAVVEKNMAASAS